MTSAQPPTAPVRRAFSLAVALLLLAGSASAVLVLRSPRGAEAAPTTAGYWLMATDGGVFAFGKAGFYGSTGDIPLNQPIVGTTAPPSGRGYWMVASDGGIFAFGDAGFHGSMGGTPLNMPIVAMAPTPTGKGYWLAAADGGIFAFGDAGFHGSMGGEKLNKPIVDIAATPSGKGYWMTATDGGIFAFGDAPFLGSTGDIELELRIHAMSSTPTGKGYWLVAGDGGVFAFGDAGFHGSGVGKANKRVLDLAPSASGKGYYMTTSEGQVLAFGDAKFHGSTVDIRLNNRITSITAMAGNDPPVAVDDVISLDEDGVATADLLANDRDPDGDELSLEGVSRPRHGTATVVGDGVVYRPRADYNGIDSFTYTVADDRGGTATGKVSVAIKAIDDKVEAVDDTVVVLEDIPHAVPVLRNDRGLGDGVKSITVESEPRHGTATVNRDRTIIYRPDRDFSGDDSFEYEVTDTDGDSSSAKVRITVVPVDDVPEAVDDSVDVRPGRDITVDVTANDISPDGIRYVKFADDDGNPTEAGEILTKLGGTARREDGKIRYSPPKDLDGTDTFRYVIVDDDGDVSAPATVTASVNNEPPTVSDGSFTVQQGQKVGGNLADLVEDDDGHLRFAKVSGSSLVTIASDGRFTYGPAGTPGTDTFRFRVTDGAGHTAEGTVEITIRPAPTTTTTSAPPPSQQ